MKNKIHYTRQEVMGQLQVPREPTTYEYLEFPDNSNEARTLRTEHPVVMAFEEKYEGVSWRARLNG